MKVDVKKIGYVLYLSIVVPNKDYVVNINKYNGGEFFNMFQEKRIVSGRTFALIL